jgi:hypothetical protein
MGIGLLLTAASRLIENHDTGLTMAPRKAKRIMRQGTAQSLL